jgi:peptidyl-prolyl cis-trans isomerase C
VSSKRKPNSRSPRSRSAKQTQPEEAQLGLAPKKKSMIAAVLSFFLVAALVIGLISGDFGEPTLEGEQVVVVEGEKEIDASDLKQGIKEAAALQGEEKAPKPNSPIYQQLAQTTLQEQVMEAWLEAEAKEEEIKISESETKQRLDQVIEQQFPNRKQFAKFRESTGLSEDDLLKRIRIMMLNERFQELAADSVEEVTDKEIEVYYRQNISNYSSGPTRDAYIIVSNNEKEINKVAAALEENPGKETWKKESKVSEVPSPEEDAFFEGLIEEQMPPPLNEELFAAPVGEVVGPIKQGKEHYIFEVAAENQEDVASLDDVKEQIKEELTATRQQEALSSFQEKLHSKWAPRTICREDYLFELCLNFEIETPPGQPAVPGRAVVDPAQADLGPLEQGIFSEPEELEPNPAEQPQPLP